MEDTGRKRSATIRVSKTPEESTNPKEQREEIEPMPSRQTKSSSPSNPANDDDETIPRLVYRL